MLAETKAVVNIQLTPTEANLLITLLDEHCETYSAPSKVAKFHEELLDMVSELLGERNDDRYVR